VKKILAVGLFLAFAFSESEGIQIPLGASKEEVLSILGEPDLKTTREDLSRLIYPKKLDMERYRYKYEFWIYFKTLAQRENWGYVEFDKEGRVVDWLIHSRDKLPTYKVEGKEPSIQLYEQIGKFNGDDWNLMPDKSKLLLVLDIIDRLRSKGILIRKSPLYYLEELDSFFKDIGHTRFTVINTLYCFAVLNRDWDDGSDKEERIKKLLPSDMWSEFVR
jgi:hypothetical protein